MAFQTVLTLATRDWVLTLKSRNPGATEGLPQTGAEVRVRAPGFVTSDEHSVPSVFENRIYTVTVKPVGYVELVRVGHPLVAEVEDSLEQVSEAWHGTIKTGNDIGWFALEVVVADGVSRRTDLAAWQVWPTKLDLATDLQAITKTIEDTYPLWLFRFRSPTTQDAGRTARRADPFLLFWFANFQSLWDQLSAGLRTVILQPHVRLTGTPARRRADQLRGRLSPRLEELVVAGRTRPEARFEAELWTSSLDTPENRFVLHVLDSSLEGLARFQAALTMPGVSKSFRDSLSGWVRQVRSYRAASMFRGLGPYTGLSQESLVLHHRAGYSAVYRSWLKLRQTLQFFASVSHAQLGLRSVNELYEIWCFLRLKELLIDLGFKEREHAAARWTATALERNLENGQGAAFVLTHPEGPEVRLSHEPVFHRNKKERFRSLSVAQKPDIVLEAIWKGPDSKERRLLWIFDAKYRVKPPTTDPEDPDEGRPQDWLVPPDALDQMHRYRDAILHNVDKDDATTRPVVSAFALYPARMEQTPVNGQENPYHDAIEGVGIGAFPLVPGDDGAVWLSQFLEKTLRSPEFHEPEDLVRQRQVQIPVELLQYREEDLLLLDAERLLPVESRQAAANLTLTQFTLDAGIVASRVRMAAVTWVGFAVPDPVSGQRLLHGAQRLKTRLDGPGTYELGTPVSLGSPQPLNFSGPPFRYADLRDHLNQ